MYILHMQYKLCLFGGVLNLFAIFGPLLKNALLASRVIPQVGLVIIEYVSGGNALHCLLKVGEKILHVLPGDGRP